MAEQLRGGLNQIVKTQHGDDRLRSQITAQDHELTQERSLIKHFKYIAKMHLTEGTGNPLANSFLFNISFLADCDNAVRSQISSQQLKKKYPGYQRLYSERLNPQERAWFSEIEQPYAGIALPDLLTNGRKLAGTHPVQVYSHYLTRVFETSDFADRLNKETLQAQVTGDADSFAASYFNLGGITDDILHAVTRVHPKLMKFVHPTRELRRTFTDAKRGTRTLLYKPDHVQFGEVQKLTEHVLDEGTESEKDRFLSDMLDIRNPAESRASYRKLLPFVRSNPGGIHDRLQQSIMDSYDELSSEELDSLGIPKPEGSVNMKTELENLHRLKSELFKLLPRKSGSVEIQGNGVEHTFEDPGKLFEYQNNGNGGLLLVGFEWTDEAGEKENFALQLDKSKTVDWNLLQVPDELPELFAAMVVQANTLMAQIVDERKPKKPGIQEPDKQNGRKIHYHDETYALRKIKDIEGVGSTVFQNGNHTPTETHQRKTKYEVESEELAERLKRKSPGDEDRLKKALTTDEDGKIKKRVKQFLFRAPDGRKIYSIRDGQRRIVCFEGDEPGKLVAVDYGDREKVYNKYMPSKTA